MTLEMLQENDVQVNAESNPLKEAALAVVKEAEVATVVEHQEEKQEQTAVTLEQVPELVASGTQLFAIANYESAVEKFALAVEALAKHHGQTAPECADTLVLYGKALLANAIQKNALCGGDAALKVAEVVEAEKTEKEMAAAKSGTFVFEGDEEEEEEDQDEGCPLDEVDLGEESDDLELAWESLDLARLIYSNMTSDADKLKLADVYLALGDTSLESENFDQAVQDFKEAVEIKEKLLPAGHRELAEAHYKFALGLEYSEALEEALEQVKITMEILEKKISLLQAEENKEESEKEIMEIQELFPEMQAKQDELKSQLENESKEEDTEELAGPSSSANDVVVMDINSLVKKATSTEESTDKKRKMEVDEQEAEELKKTKTTESI